MARKEDGNRSQEYRERSRKISEVGGLYSALVLSPFIYRNAADRVVHAISEGSIATARAKNLTRFLENGMPGKMYPEKDIEWGRAVFSEIVAAEVLRTSLPVISSEHNIDLRLSPTAFDRSVRDFKHPHYQKGGDVLIFENDGSENIPLLLVDVTIGSRGEVKEKESPLGLNAVAGMPVVVIPFADISIPIGKGERAEVFPFAEALELLKDDFIKTSGKLRLHLTKETKTQVRNMVLAALRKIKSHLQYVAEKPDQIHSQSSAIALQKILYLESILG